MANQEKLVCISLPVAADYSTTGIYRFVDIDTSGRAVLVAGAGAEGVGVLQNDPAAAGRAGEVAIYGKTKVIAGGTVAAGDWVQSDANAAATTAASGDYVFGKCVLGADSGELIEVLLVSPHKLA